MKNIIILILGLLNVFLLAALALRGTEAHTAEKIRQRELVALFAADGMTLDPDLIPEDTDLSGWTLQRDEELEQSTASFWLGEQPERTSQGGGICTYSSAQGTAAFRDTGSFDVAGTLAEQNARALCEEFCRKFSYTEPVFTLDDTGSGIGTAVRQWEGAPVFNSTVTFTLEQGMLTAVSGSLLPDRAEAAPAEQPMLTAFAALTAFQQMRHESSSVVSTITEISLCYELQSTAVAPMTLSPTWRIATDTAAFYVNCVSGTVRRA